MEPQNKQDKERAIKAGHLCKRWDYIYAACRDWLRAIDVGRPKTHPVELADITFSIFSSCLATFKKQAAKRPPIGGNKDKTVVICLSAALLACLALSHLYLKSRVDKENASKDLWSQLSMYNKGS